MASSPTLTLLFVQKYSCLYNKKKITRWLEDINFIFSWYETIFYSLAALVREILFLPRALQNKIHIFAPPYPLYIDGVGRKYFAAPPSTK